MEEIERLQQELIEAQRGLAGIQKDMDELLKGYSGFDDLIMGLEEMKRANEKLPEELTAKLEEIIRAVERRKTT